MKKNFYTIIPINILKNIYNKYGKIIFISQQNEAITNTVFYIETTNNKLLLKLLSKEKSVFNRLDEIKVIKYSMKYNITPKLLDYKLKSYLLFEYVSNYDYLSVDNDCNKAILSLAKHISVIHNADIKINNRSYKNTINKYLKNVMISSDNIHIINTTLTHSSNILKNIKQFPLNLGLSHNDINNFNVIKTKEGKLYILDFEYASINDIYFDLASVYNTFGKNQFNIFITEYTKITSINFSIDKLLLYVKLIYVISILWAYKMLTNNHINNNKLIYNDIINKNFMYLQQNN
jgi:thiamine kinase-like enzyme